LSHWQRKEEGGVCERGTKTVSYDRSKQGRKEKRNVGGAVTPVERKKKAFWGGKKTRG